MLTLQLAEIPNSKGKCAAAIGAEVIVARASMPVADACKTLAARGVTGMIRVGWREGSSFLADIARTAAWMPSPAAARVRRHWEGVSNTDAF
jgi:hypothetical protein